MKPRFCTFFLLTSAIPAVAQTRTDADGDRLPEGAIARIGSSRFRTDKFFADFTFSPDGKLIAGASYGGRLTVWEVATGREVTAIKGSFGAVRFTADGKQVVVGSATAAGDQELRCFEAQTGREVLKIGDRDFRVDWRPNWKVLEHQWKIGANDTLWVHGSPEPGLRELRGFELPRGREIIRTRVPDGMNLLDWTTDGTRLFLKTGRRLAVHDVKAGKAIWELELGKSADFAHGMTPDGKRIVTHEHERLRVYEVGSGHLTAEMRLTEAAWRPDPGLFIPHDRYAVIRAVSASGPVDFFVADLERGKVCLNLPMFAVHSWTFSPDGRYFVARAGLGTSVWDLTRSSADPVVRLPRSSTARFSPDGRILALDGGGCIGLYDVATWRLLRQSASPASFISSVRFTPDGRGLVGLTAEGWRTWDDWSKPESRPTFGEGGRPESGYSLLSDDMRVRAETFDAGSLLPKFPMAAEVLVIDHQTGRTRTHPVARWPDRDVVLSGDGQWLFTWTWNQESGGEVHGWDTATGIALRTWVTKAPRGSTIAVSRDGRWLALFQDDSGSGASCYIRLWEVERGREVGRIKGVGGIGPGHAESATFSRDGRLLAAVVFAPDEKKTGAAVRVWDWRNEKQLLSVTVADFMSVVTLSADGRSCAVGDDDGRLRVFEVASGGERAAFRHGARVASVALHPDGTKVAASSPEAPVYIWDLLGEPGRWEGAKANAIWTGLASTDAKAAFAAMRLLRANPVDAIAFLQGRSPLPPAPTDEHLADLLKRLDAPAFADRERAQKELTEVVEWVRPKLEAARATASAEAGSRIEQILSPADRLTFEQLRQVRVCEVLEGIGSAEAVKVLRVWATGPARARLTLAAKESLERLRP